MPRNSDPIFWPTDEISLSLKQQISRNYQDSINILQTQWYQADLDQRFAMADQDIWGILFPGVATYRRKIFNFNLINSHIQMVSGYQRRNRKSSICVPIHSPIQKTADQLTKCLYYVHSNSGAYQVYSDAFELGALTQGLGFVSIFPDKTKSPLSPDIRLRYIDMKSCIYDPFFRRHDMMDARFWQCRQFFHRNEAAILYPELADKILALPRGSYQDDKFYYMPEVYQIQFPDLMAFDEYWYLSSREATFLVDVDTEETQEFNGTKEKLDEIMFFFKDKLKVIKQSKQTVRRAILVNDRLVVDEEDPYKIDRYPVVPMLGYFTADTPYYSYKFRGLTRDLRDVQYLFNRLKVSNLDQIEAQQQGLKIKQGCLVTPNDGLNAGHGRILTIKAEAQMSDVEYMPIHAPDPTLLQMEEMLKGLFNTISGVNETMLGADINDKAGIISMLRNSAGITTLTRLFDQFDEAQRTCSEIIVGMIQSMWTYGKVRQVIGEEPTPEFDNKLFFKYGCKVVQGALTETQQQLQLQQLLYFRETTGIPIPAKSIIEASTLQNKDDLIKAIAEEEQKQSQQQQQMAELQMQQIQVDNMTKMGYAKSQEALANERQAKISTDIAIAEDKLKRAHQEDTKSLLDVVKALKELQGMDLNNLKEKLNILNMLSPAVEGTGQVVQPVNQ